jgi:hypothetical protein
MFERGVLSVHMNKRMMRGQEIQFDFGLREHLQLLIENSKPSFSTGALWTQRWALQRPEGGVPYQMSESDCEGAQTGGSIEPTGERCQYLRLAAPGIRVPGYIKVPRCLICRGG